MAVDTPTSMEVVEKEVAGEDTTNWPLVTFGTKKESSESATTVAHDGYRNKGCG